MAPEKNDTTHDKEWRQRTLCIDEACIGIIGPDGRCKECGTPHPEWQPEDDNSPVANATSELSDDLQLEEEQVDANDDEPGTAPDDEWLNRTLCRDEACIGVIGPDGRCKECGQPYEP